MKIEDYKYKGITPNEEGDIIGYALIKPGTILEDGTEIDDECIHCSLCSPPLKDIAAIKKIKEEVYITSIVYSKYGNYLGDEKVWFVPIDIESIN